jgi:hypothetical protein
VAQRLDHIAGLREPAQLGDDVAGERLVRPFGQLDAGGLLEVVEVEQAVDLDVAAAQPPGRGPRRTRRGSRR